MLLSFVYLYTLLLAPIITNDAVSADYTLQFVSDERCLNEDCKYNGEIQLIKEKTDFLEYVTFLPIIYNSSLLRDIESIHNYEIIFNRNNIPIIFDATVYNLEDISEWIEYNKESKVIYLDDNNFEHLTQASSGSTTGDWMLLFYKDECHQIQPIWEALASNFNQRLMTASINVTTISQTSQRFSIVDCPSIKYLRHGKIYAYNIPSFALDKLTSFANGWYKNFPSKKVPPLPTPFDVLTDTIAYWLKDNVSAEVLLVFMFLTIIGGSLILFQIFRPKICQDLKEE